MTQNDHEKGFHLIKHAPHLWEPFVEGIRRNMDNIDALKDWGRNHLCIFAAVFGTPGPAEASIAAAKAGAFDVVFDVLERHVDDDAVFQAGMCAFSDNVQSSRAGAE